MFSDSDKSGYYVIRRELVGWDQFHKEIESGPHDSRREANDAKPTSNDDDVSFHVRAYNVDTSSRTPSWVGGSTRRTRSNY